MGKLILRLGIEIENADVSIEGKKVLSNISWNLEEGEHWAVLGENGAGKSTLLKLLRGEIWPDPNNGRRIYKYEGQIDESPAGIRDHIALVSAEKDDFYSRYNIDITCHDVLYSGFSDSIWLFVDPAEEQKKEAEKISNLFGIKHLLDRDFLTLSEGEKRKVLVARALAPNPDVLLLDEVTDGLDPNSKESLSRILNRIALNGTRIILSTHQKEIPSFVTHVLFLKNGRIAFKGEIKSWNSFSEKDYAKPDSKAPKKAESPRKGRSLIKFLIEVKKADIFIGTNRILKNINWKMGPHENWAILGPNGSGKSTFLKMIMGELHPALGGEINWFGSRSKTERPDMRELRKRIGHVSSALQAQHSWDLTGFDVVLSGFFSSIGLYDRASPLQKDMAAREMEISNIGHLKKKFVNRMSYGELRKVLLARALVHGPEMLLLDEPCKGLDRGTRNYVLNRLDEVSRTRARLIMVTHNPLDLIPGITKVLYLDSGRIKFQGPRKDFRLN